ncbi:DUF1831 domain-containing protein [Vagococcus salmoninarum]|uniref:Cysteine desulfurase n=1 Tax=Vagococcus salmoninarum TaxID=2739 RepID=A0A429ZVA8_9ENTE|nr:DUF1831 domain-containing protein [Vagococcus salmoninarum]MBE9387785.1 DUF1831 domain-containing protein [Vagococcus salmoninarum]RST97719.1 cysteine desulfurase [Vagococcus salmoninarum]
MAFEQTATVLGCPISYKIGQEAKKYTMRDNGFTETKSGNFQLIRPLDATPQSKQGFKLKITVSEDLETLKMSVTTANGMKALDIFSNDKFAMNQEKFYFLMDGMIDRGCFEKVE